MQQVHVNKREAKCTFFTKDEHKFEHKTIFNIGIYTHLRN